MLIIWLYFKETKIDTLNYISKYKKKYPAISKINMEKLQEYLNDNNGEYFTISSLSKQYNTSYSTMYRIIKNFMKLKYVRCCRINIAGQQKDQQDSIHYIHRGINELNKTKLFINFHR